MDLGMRISTFHYFWGATWSPNNMTDFNTLKYLLFAQFSAFMGCWTGIPFEVARKAYFADQSWPAEMRKGYRSPLHALLKIPFTEGPLFLFKGGLVTYVGNAQFTAWTFFFYSWLKNHTFYFFLYNDINYSWVKFWNMNASFALGSIIGYPVLGLKNALDNWPKERGGHTTWNGSAYNALKWLKQNHQIYAGNMTEGYWRYMRRQGFIFYIAMWEADNMGLFTNNMAEQNALLTIRHLNESD